MAWILLIAVAIILVFWLAPRPTLDPRVPDTKLPADIPLEDLDGWLAAHEAAHDAIIEGTEATINWADGQQCQDLCLLYVHGFSATRQETAPVTARVAESLGANVVYTRLAGHGLSEGAMEAEAEHWLQSMVDSWEIASRIGRRVVVIAVSTGAPLAVWLNEHVAPRDQVHSFIFMAPNFKIRNPFGFLLTWPWAPRWIPNVLGAERHWEPATEPEAKFWSNRYSIHAVIEMQKVVDWARKQKLNANNVPLATLYMAGDPTINHEAAAAFHHAWDADTKAIYEVDIDADNPQHVFVGDITAPHRIDWTVETCINFIKQAS